MVLGPVALGDDEDQIRVGLLDVFVEAPQQMRRYYQPGDIDNDNVAQWEGHKKGGLNSIVPVLERRVNGQKHKEHQVENPVESAREGN